MKIIVKDNEGRNFRLPIPTGIILNRFVAGIAPKYLKKYGIHITREQAIAFVIELNRYRRKHPQWVFVEAQSADDEYVYIKL